MLQIKVGVLHEGPLMYLFWNLVSGCPYFDEGRKACGRAVGRFVRVEQIWPYTCCQGFKGPLFLSPNRGIQELVLRGLPAFCFRD